MLINLIVVDRYTGKIKDVSMSTDWEVKEDLLSSAASTFALSTPIPDTGITAGDFVIAKVEGEPFGKTRDVKVLEYEYGDEDDGVLDATAAFYYGVVDSYANQSLTTKMLMEVANVDTVLYSNNLAESDPGMYLWRRFANDVIGSPELYVTHVTQAATPQEEVLYNWSFVLDQPQKENLLSLFISFFQQTQTFLRTEGYILMGTGDTINFIVAPRRLVSSSDYPSLVVIMDNSDDIVNPSVFVKPVNSTVPNSIRIFGPVPSDGGDAPTEDWYLKADGSVSNKASDMPKTLAAKTAIFFDPSKESKEAGSTPATAKDIARQNLTPQYYQHEISFDVNIGYRDIDRLMVVGTKVRLIYKGTIYDSIITAYDVKSSSNYVTISCGNIRTTLNAVLS